MKKTITIRGRNYWKTAREIDRDTLKAAEAALRRNEKTKKLPVEQWATGLADDLSKFTD